MRVLNPFTVPPKQMKIVDERGQEIDDVIGPYDEDSTLQLVCLVIGGKSSLMRGNPFHFPPIIRRNGTVWGVNFFFLILIFEHFLFKISKKKLFKIFIFFNF